MSNLFPSNSLFGAKTSTPSFGNFGSTGTVPGFGTSTASPQTGFSFGTSISSSNSATSNTGISGFSFGANQSKLSFGVSTPQISTSGFNSTMSTSPFTSNTTTGIFNTGGQNNLNQTSYDTESDLFILSVSQPSRLGDDRDVIITRWNQLQAMWGSGTGLSSHGKSIYTPENFLCRFKAVSFSQIPNCEDSEGLIALLVKNPFKDVLSNKKEIQNKLNQLINIQTASIIIEDIQPAVKSFTDNLPPVQPKPSFGFPQQPALTPAQSALPTNNVEYTFVSIRLNESVNGVSRYLPASNLVAFLKNEPCKSKLASEIGVIDIIPQVEPQSKEINDYLSGLPPRGLHTDIWEKARQQCGNSNNIIPVPVVGMVELKARIRGQIEFAQSQMTKIRTEAETISEMKTKVISMSGKIEQLKRKQIELSNRILKILCTQEILSRQGYTLSAEEEALKCSLDKLWNQLVGSYGIKVRLQEILSAPKDACNNSKINSRLTYNQLNSGTMEELKEYFYERQKSIKEMMTLIREDIACLNIIENV